MFKLLWVPTAQPDIAYPRSHRQILPSWSSSERYLNTEHENISELTKSITGWQSEGDAYKLYEMAYHAGDVILEIGTYSGRSAVIEILGSRANSLRKRTRWFGLDLDPAAIDRTRTTLENWKLAEYATLFRGDLSAFMKKHRISPTMVFVDGDHAYNGVKSDIGLLAQFLGPNVPILFHDYLNPETEGVQRACDEWEKTGRVKFLGCFGCSALFVTLKGKLWARYQLLREKLRSRSRA